MADLENKERQDLINLLSSISLLGTYEGRRALVIASGLEKHLPFLELQGNTFVTIVNFLNHLESYGRDDTGIAPLGQFLNTIIQSSAVGISGQSFLAELIEKYALMVPVTVSKPISVWSGSGSTEYTHEKIIGENTLRPISFLEQAMKMSQAVCYLQVGDNRAGTGFMISPSLLLTCHHVLTNRADAQETTFRFNFQTKWGGAMSPYHEYHMVNDGLYASNKDLDYTVVELENEPGHQWGWLALTETSPKVGDRVNIIQHPAARPKHISFQNNFIEYVSQSLIQYITSTLPGSSGSPVFDDEWRVVALHHAGGMLAEPTTQRRFFRNQGVRMTHILRDFPQEVIEKIEGSQARE